MRIKLRITDVLHAGRTYSSTRFALLGLNEILFLPCAAAKAKSCGVCGVFEFFKFRTLSLPPSVAATSVFNFLWITISSQSSTPGVTYVRICYPTRERVRSYILNAHSRAAVSHCQTVGTKILKGIVKTQFLL